MIYYIRKINGVVPPFPEDLTMSRMDLDLDTHRTASGKLIRNKVAEKMKFEVTFPVMNKTTMGTVLGMLNTDAISVEYEDMFTGAVKTGTFYHGDISTKILKTRGTTNTDVWFKPFTVSLVEY